MRGLQLQVRLDDGRTLAREEAMNELGPEKQRLVAGAAAELERKYANVWCMEHETGLKAVVGFGADGGVEIEFDGCCEEVARQVAWLNSGEPERLDRLAAAQLEKFKDVLKSLGIGRIESD